MAVLSRPPLYQATPMATSPNGRFIKADALQWSFYQGQLNGYFISQLNGHFIRIPGAPPPKNLGFRVLFLGIQSGLCKCRARLLARAPSAALPLLPSAPLGLPALAIGRPLCRKGGRPPV